MSMRVRWSSLAGADFALALYKVLNHSNEYWYIWSKLDMSMSVN